MPDLFALLGGASRRRAHAGDDGSPPLHAPPTLVSSMRWAGRGSRPSRSTSTCASTCPALLRNSPTRSWKPSSRRSERPGGRSRARSTTSTSTSSSEPARPGTAWVTTERWTSPR
ncbi:hypothetical protein NKG05_14860 [Oerskovia sp. M15]